MGQSIAFIGGGNMAESLVAGLLKAGRQASEIAIAEPDAARREHLRRFTGITLTADNARAASGAALVVLAVKPQVAPAALAAIAKPLRRERPSLLSIAAGVRIAAIVEALGETVPVARAMPNTPALVGCGASAWYANAATEERGRRLVREVLEAAGLAIEVQTEAELDAVTGVSGSGPAYFFLLVEALAAAGSAQGLGEETAARLAAATGAGAMALLEQSGESPAALRKRVTSPGGTTAAALATLEDGGFDELIARAVASATARAQELGGK